MKQKESILSKQNSLYFREYKDSLKISNQCLTVSQADDIYDKLKQKKSKNDLL